MEAKEAPPDIAGEVKRKAVELYARGESFRSIQQSLAQQFGAEAPGSHAAVFHWYTQDTDAWDAAAETHMSLLADQLDLEAERARLRQANRKLNRLLVKRASWNSAEVGQIWALLAIKKAIEREIDPEFFVRWIERFGAWCCSSLSEREVQTVKPLLERFTSDVREAYAEESNKALN